MPRKNEGSPCCAVLLVLGLGFVFMLWDAAVNVSELSHLQILGIAFGAYLILGMVVQRAKEWVVEVPWTEFMVWLNRKWQAPGDKDL
ncbi:hypothetical protein ACFV5G_19485 [Streptomyces sp. NPDC059766]|uniref:hypothetical protein n=1 Tax=Streptomyces sp. NPDC059766 TaxID=3346940 RepID=UPI003656DD1D